MKALELINALNVFTFRVVKKSVGYASQSVALKKREQKKQYEASLRGFSLYTMENRLSMA